MKKIVALLIILIGGTAYASLNYHFIRMDSGFEVLKKVELTLEDTYIDARGVKKLKLLTKPSLIKAGIKDLMSSKK